MKNTNEILLPTFKNLEKLVRKIVCEYGCQLIKEILEALDDKLCMERDRSMYRHKGKKKTSIKTVLGDIEFERVLYFLPAENKYIYLLDDVMNLDKDCIGKITLNLAEQIAQNACETPYRKAAQNISELTEQSISHQAAWNVVQKLSEEIKKKEERKQKIYAGEMGDKKEKLILFEEADGVMLKMQGEDRKKAKVQEMKIGIFYEGWEETAKNRYELYNKKIVCEMTDPRSFGALIEAKIASIYNIDEINYRLFNSDGAAWLRNLHEEDDTVYKQLDKFHVKQAIRNALLPADINKLIKNYYEDCDIDNMLMIIDAYANSICDTDVQAEERVRALYNYLNDNKEGLIPCNKRNLNLPKPEKRASGKITYRGMGACEHNVELTVSRRMKHCGATWSRKGANNLAKLIALKLTGDLKEAISGLCHLLPERLEELEEEFISYKHPKHKEGKGFESKDSRIAPNAKVYFKELLKFKTFSELNLFM